MLRNHLREEYSGGLYSSRSVQVKKHDLLFAGILVIFGTWAVIFLFFWS